MAENASSRPAATSESTFSPPRLSNLTSVGSNPVGSNTQFQEKAPVQEKKESKFWLDPEEFSLRKRLPPSLPRRNIDVYVTNKTHFKAQLNRCERLIDEEITNIEDNANCTKGTEASDRNVLIYLHALGAAIPRALNLALQLQRKYGSRIQLDTITSTVELTDDFEPLVFEQSTSATKESITHNRYNSAVHIKISRHHIPGSSGVHTENENSRPIAQQEQ